MRESDTFFFCISSKDLGRQLFSPEMSPHLLSTSMSSLVLDIPTLSSIAIGTDGAIMVDELACRLRDLNSATIRAELGSFAGGIVGFLLIVSADLRAGKEVRSFCTPHARAAGSDAAIESLAWGIIVRVTLVPACHASQKECKRRSDVCLLLVLLVR